MEISTITDWSIIGIILIFITVLALRTRKYANSVSSFLVADRCAGRYLIAVAQGEAAWGAITVLMMWQNFSQTGWSQAYWAAINIPLGMFIAISGWVIYRFRETRAMTLAQFFEMRYSRGFRIFAGIMACVSGVINFGIFPAVAGRFFISWLEIPNFHIQLGIFDINMTLAAVMAVLLGLALFFTFIGGQVAVIVTDFWQGVIASIVFLTVVIVILAVLGWDKLSDGLIAASEPGKSLYDPFDIGAKKDYGWTYFAIVWFFLIYRRMSYQGHQQYKGSALTPHESKMGVIFGNWRTMLLTMGLTLIPCAALTIMNLPEYSDKAVIAGDYLNNAFPGDDMEKIRHQFMVPTALKQILPMGVTGLFAAAILGFFISTNNSVMHSFGSIFVQDVLCPLKKKPFTQKQHLKILKISIFCVAIFGFTFSLLYPQRDFIFMFLQVTAAIFGGGAGAAIIGGLYWKRGTTAGAWTGMIVGAIMASGSIVLRQAWPNIDWLVQRWGDSFPINGQKMAFISAMSAVLSYVIVSLIQWKKPINMDKLLHRGEYEVEEDRKTMEEVRGDVKPITRFWKFIGINKDCSKLDRFIFILLWSYNMYIIARFIVLFVLWSMGIMRGQTWLKYWHYFIFEYFVIGLGFTIWVTTGGIIDLKKMYKRLDIRAKQASEADDGRVKEEEHLAEKED